MCCMDFSPYRALRWAKSAHPTQAWRANCDLCVGEFRRMVSVRVLRPEQNADSLGDDIEVESERPVAQIFEIVIDAALHFFEHVGFASIAVHLGPSGDARRDFVAQHV